MPKIINKGVLTIVCACLVSVCYTQSSIIVKSFEDRRPLPYASIANLTKHQLHFSDENGLVSANFDIGDSIFISYVGYQDLKARIDSTGSRIYLLKQSNTTLKPVQILYCNHVVRNKYSNLVPDSAAKNYRGVSWTKGPMNGKIAVMLRPGFEDGRLNAFSIWLERFRETPRTAIEAPMIFSFYSIDDSTMLPGELISNQQVIYYPKKEGKQTIRVDSLRLRIPKRGIYVCIQYIITDKYLWPVRSVDSHTGIDSVTMHYGGIIDGVYSKNFALAFYDYEKNSWAFPLHRDKSTLGEVRGTIKFLAEISTCKE